MAKRSGAAAAAVPGISDAEWDVMKVVWDAEPIAASEVAKKLADQRQWHPQTVKTLLTRLVQKGALAYTAEGKRYLYRSRISREACAKRESRTFLSRVFDGAATPAVVHLITHSRFSREELKQLRELLDAEAK